MGSFKNNLPKTWAYTSLGEAYEVIGGGTPSTEKPEYWGGDIPWITSADIEGVRQINVRKHVTDKGIVGSTTSKVPPRTLLVVTRVGLGKIAISDAPICFSQDLQGLVQEPELICPEYTLYLLSYELQILKFEGRGTTISGVTKKQLKDLGFPLPPIKEQKRIVAKIEELFSELDKGIESFKTAREQLKVYRQVLLNEAAKGDLSTQRDDSKTRTEKTTVSLNDVVLSVGQGWSPRCLEHPSESHVTWGVIKTSAIQPLDFISSANKQLPDPLEPRPHLEIFPGDVLITRAGPRNRVGIACYVKSVRPRLMVCDKVYRIKVKQDKILPEFLVMLLNSPRVLEELETLKTGISDSGLNLTQDRFLSMKVVVPSLETQRSILEDLEQKLSNVAFFEAQLDSSLGTAETLRQSILKKAFSGQLVAQNPDDEPASKLLARIKAEKAAQAKPAKQKAKTSKLRTKKD